MCHVECCANDGEEFSFFVEEGEEFFDVFFGYVVAFSEAVLQSVKRAEEFSWLVFVET
jgi:hypothetical protein